MKQAFGHALEETHLKSGRGGKRSLMKKDLAVTLIELPSTVDGRLDGKLAKDIYSLLHYPARGVPLLTAEMKRAGFRDTVAINPEYNRGTPGHLNSADWQRLLSSDVVGISAITRTA